MNDILTKEAFIKTVLAQGRKMQLLYKNETPCNPFFYYKMYSVSNGKTCEHWEIHFYVNEKVKTDMTLWNHSNPIKYKLTEWGEEYSRWDSELKEFLEREALKEA